ncbi:MAG: aminomethyl-transferring glycine dehydrogenase [Bacteroidales bacterium]
MSVAFIHRHNGPSESEVKEMLQEIGVESLEQLIEETVPNDIIIDKPLDLDEAVTEQQYLTSLKKMVSQNQEFRSLIGMGFYGTGTLPAVIRNIFENPVWYTSYTPYQSEISQGRLEALLNFQTMVSTLTGFQMANSSMLDDSTAAAEAVRMMYELRSREAQRANKNLLFVDENIFPQVLAVIETRSEPINIEIEIGKFDQYNFNDRCFGAVLQYPAANGDVRDYSKFCEAAHQKGILVTAVTDLLSLAILKEPAAWGADIAVGTTQRFGLPMGFGGPTTGFIATREEYKRHTPGRIIGVSVDRLGNKALRMALQTREQHIKREKATSNICTASALMATMSGMYGVYHGPEGLKEIANTIRRYTTVVATVLEQNGFKLASKEFFDTLEVIDVDASAVEKRALAAKYNLFYPTPRSVRFSFDELTGCTDVLSLLSFFGIEVKECPKVTHRAPTLARTTTFMQEATFNKFHSETELMRYIKKLERRDLSLTHSMIPLGSCTMKLNAAVEMMPMSWSELASIHPLVPKEQAKGYLDLIAEVERDLAVITGFDACSLQPNSGAAGEYAGLMTIRAFQHANGQANRTVVLIPTSAHGTNPASAAMAGMEIVLVACDENGNVDIEDLKKRAQEHSKNLSSIMITYPSTHGVYEEGVKEICQIVHNHGGLVYMDGANMNAQVGITNPGVIGADVCHLNLHKTFAIPHGGGGPGIGPICCTKELAPYLPSHPFDTESKSKGVKGVSSAQYGYPMALPVTHAYIKLLGASGLKRATQIAILNANYISVKLKEHYKTLYTGKNGRVAHESILDLRGFRREYGADATDVAKRLMDYGFHAPTLSFPVVDTLMVEPTESESKGEIDRFIEAMVSIKRECDRIKEGEVDSTDNLLKNAPHTVDEVSANEWSHPYSREEAAFPLEWIRENKFWPRVARVDNGYGDRNLMCSCEGWIED